MFEQLKSSEGNKIAVELVNGKQIAGTVVAVNQQDIRLETDEGICVILISAIQVIWENPNRSLIEEDMKFIAHELETASGDNPTESGMPCFQAYAKPCMFAYAQPCYQPYGQPCMQTYAQPCCQPYTPSPCPQPCFERYGYFEHHCFERYFGHHPSYPYPPYPYPPYPYPPYPYAGDQVPGEASQQSQTSTMDSKAESEKGTKE